MPTAVFDVNETMLDLADLDALFAEVFGDPRARREWFARLLHLSVTANALAIDSDFGALGGEALEATGRARGIAIDETARVRLGGAIRSLRAHPDVTPALVALRGTGWRLIALTNSSAEMAGEQLAAAELADHFDRVLSVEAVGRFKPAPEPYLYAAEVSGAAREDIWMVAAHDWDLAGAAGVGLKTAYVERAGMMYGSIYPAPTVRAPDMLMLVQRMLESESR